MTEAQWLVSADPDAMQEYLRRAVPTSDRSPAFRLRLLPSARATPHQPQRNRAGGRRALRRRHRRRAGVASSQNTCP